MITNEEIYNGLINQCKECKANHTDDCDDCKIPLVMVAMFKQIPLKGTIKNSFTNKCVCGASIYPHMKHCSQCGQRLDWRMDND